MVEGCSDAAFQEWRHFYGTKRREHNGTVETVRYRNNHITTANKTPCKGSALTAG